LPGKGTGLPEEAKRQMPSPHEPVRYVDLVIGALQRFPERIAFRQDGRDLTYAQAADLLCRWVSVFRSHGLRIGDGVGVLSPNRPEVWLAQTATPMAGGRFTALHPMGSFDDHRYICDEAELRFLIVDPVYAERAAELAERCGSLTAVFTLGEAGAGEDITALAAEASPAALDGGPHGAEDIAWLLYTGGTTGVPKAAMLPERALAQAWTSVAVGWDLPRDIRYLACAPISHAAGMLITPTLLAGGTVILQRSFDAGRWLEAVEVERITVGLLVPTMIYSILDHPELDATDLSSLQTIMYGASPISPARLAEGIARIGPVFCQLYGQTECLGIATSFWKAQHGAQDLHRLSACGTPMPGVRVAILDDDGEPVPDGAPGEICVRGASVMQGYWKQPELTAATLRDGWLRTGDVAVREPDGLIFIVDRKKDMIVSGGFNVFPREVEDVLSAHPAVSAVAVIGVPDEKWGEAVKAVVVPRPGERAEIAELIALVREHKGPVCAPKSIELVESLPLTTVGKVDKKALRARYWAGRERLVS
jgi:fatty-acyl-CoA synthase